MFKKEQQYAQAYVPVQTTFSVFTPEEGLLKGTIFKCLYQPYEKRGWA
jgi:hypothetical protein